MIPVHRFKSILALFALLVFLFPQVEKEIHNFEHQAQVHCTDHNYVHYHNVEHHCKLCDYTHVVISSPAAILWSIADPPIITNIFLKSEEFVKDRSVNFQSLRAPPAFS